MIPMKLMSFLGAVMNDIGSGFPSRPISLESLPLREKPELQPPRSGEQNALRYGQVERKQKRLKAHRRASFVPYHKRKDLVLEGQSPTDGEGQ